LELLTPAKINLFLRITGRRADGYHELDSVFLPVSLFDRIEIEAGDAETSAVIIHSNSPDIPLDDTNLAARAARLFMNEKGLRWRLEIYLHKKIPAGAGLGGGSSDAGAVLRLMAQLHGIDPSQLAPLALQLGADVPFFLDPRPARVAGIGERIEYLEPECRSHLAIGIPPIAVSTAEVYRHLEPRKWSGPGPANLPETLESLCAAPNLLINDLESVALVRYPLIAEVKAQFQNLGAAGTLMSGSGSAVFALFGSARQAARAVESAAARMPETRFFTAWVLGAG